jgi:hypothetical protein
MCKSQKLGPAPDGDVHGRLLLLVLDVELDRYGLHQDSDHLSPAHGGRDVDRGVSVLEKKVSVNKMFFLLLKSYHLIPGGIRSHDQGCQILIGKTYPNEKKYAKCLQNLPIGRKI